MTNIIPANFGGKLSNKFAAIQAGNDFAAGVGSSYAIVKYRGKNWSYDYRGENKIIMRPDGDGPANSIEVVILKASTHKSRIYYPAYVDGQSNRPACWSTNGVSPDGRSEQRQSDTCALCPRAVKGSKVDEAGQARGSECRENKRIAIVPLGDLHNQVLGGPMLLRIPAASLLDFAQFGTQLNAMGIPYQAVGVKISFDPKLSYPKFVFEAVRTLTDEEADTVLDLVDSLQVKRIIEEETEGGAPASPMLPPPGPVSSKFANLKPDVPPPAPPKAAAPAPKPAPTPAPAPAVVEEVAPSGTSIDDELDALLN